MLYTLYIVSKSVLYIQLIAIFNPGVSASRWQVRRGARRGAPGLRHLRAAAGDPPLARARRVHPRHVAEAPWSGAEWAVAPRFDIPRATVLELVLG